MAEPSRSVQSYLRLTRSGRHAEGTEPGGLGEINQSVVGPYLSSLAADMGLSSVATELILDRAEVAIVWDVEIVKVIGVGVCEKGVFSRGRRHSSWYAPSSTSLIRTPKLRPPVINLSLQIKV